MNGGLLWATRSIREGGSRRCGFVARGSSFSAVMTDLLGRDRPSVARLAPRHGGQGDRFGDSRVAGFARLPPIHPRRKAILRWQ